MGQQLGNKDEGRRRNLVEIGQGRLWLNILLYPFIR